MTNPTDSRSRYGDRWEKIFAIGAAKDAYDDAIAEVLRAFMAQDPTVLAADAAYKEAIAAINKEYGDHD
jgi:hypothetical protein